MRTSAHQPGAFKQANFGKLQPGTAFEVPNRAQLGVVGDRARGASPPHTPVFNYLSDGLYSLLLGGGPSPFFDYLLDGL